MSGEVSNSKFSVSPPGLPTFLETQYSRWAWEDPSKGARDKGTFPHGAPSPRWEMGSWTQCHHGVPLEKPTDSTERCSENTHFKGNFPSDINSSGGYH